MRDAAYYIKKLNLQKHPEGGWFSENYRSSGVIQKESLTGNFNGERCFSTSIYYLLEKDDFSSFHRIKSDEIWHFYAGTSPVTVVWLENGSLKRELLGNNLQENEKFQVVVPANCWFAAYLADPNGFALVGCTVSPGFHFDDFELADEKLIKLYPDAKDEVGKLLRNDDKK